MGLCWGRDKLMELAVKVHFKGIRRVWGSKSNVYAVPAAQCLCCLEAVSGTILDKSCATESRLIYHIWLYRRDLCIPLSLNAI